MKTIPEILGQFSNVEKTFLGYGGVDKKEQKKITEEFERSTFERQMEVLNGFLGLHNIRIETIITGVLAVTVYHDVSINNGIAVTRSPDIHSRIDLVHDTEKESYLYWLEYALNLLESKSQPIRKRDESKRNISVSGKMRTRLLGNKKQKLKPQQLCSVCEGLGFPEKECPKCYALPSTVQ